MFGTTSRRLKSVVSFVFVFVFAGSTFTQVRDLGVNAFIGQLGPTAFQSWLDPATGDFVSIDAFNKRNTALNLGVPTTLSGKVTARPLGDGTERVTVSIRATDAICWGFNGSNVPAFGYSPLSIKNGFGPASLGETNYRIVYSPQPVGQFNPVGAQMETIMATVMCDGQLRAGSGYPAGTDGFAQTTQTGLFSTGVPGGCPMEHDADCFPAEKVQFKPRY